MVGLAVWWAFHCWTRRAAGPNSGNVSGSCYAATHLPGSAADPLPDSGILPPGFTRDPAAALRGAQRMAPTSAATTSVPNASSAIQLPTPPAGLQYYFSMTCADHAYPSLVLVIADTSLADLRRLLVRLLLVDGSSCELRQIYCFLPALPCISLQTPVRYMSCCVLSGLWSQPGPLLRSRCLSLA